MSNPRDNIEAKLGLTGPPLQTVRDSPPTIPDHELIRRIGQGAYGEVWLARNALGTWRAVKIVYRDNFKDARPYEREFAGIRRFEPLSRSNEGFVDVLQVGRDDPGGWFYYVMELADAAEPLLKGEDGGSKMEDGLGASEVQRHSPSSILNPRDYQPRTLARDLHHRGRLPLEDCLQLGLTLTLALGHLHRHGLIHRDVKPSNIIFVGGVPKLADIGLVTEAAGANTFVGTEGFVPPEGPTSPKADLYALGKVLYEAAMGKDRHEFPEPFTQIGTDRESIALMELNAVLLRACAPDPKQRYATAEEMHADLALLHSGGSVKRRHQFDRQFRIAKQVGAVAITATLLIGAALFWQRQQTQKLTRLAEEKTKLAEQNHLQLIQMQTANGIRAMDNGDPATAALWFSEVLKQSAGDIMAEQRERFRLGSLLRYLPKPVGLFQLEHDLVSMNLSADGKRLVAVSKVAEPGLGQGEIREWELSTSRLVHSISLTNIGSVRISPSGRWAVVTDSKGNRLYEVSEELRFVTNLPFGGSGGLLSAFSRDGTKLAICASAQGREVQLLEIPSGRLLAPPLIHSNDVAFIAFDGTGRQLVTGTRVEHVKKDPLEGPGKPTGLVRVWNTATGEPLTDWIQSDEVVESATFATDGKSLAIIGSLAVSTSSGENDHHVRVMDLPSGQLRFSPLAHQDTVLDAAFSPDGRFLATAGADHSVKLWDARSGDLALPPFKLGEIVWQLRFSPDGRWLAAGCETEVRVWDARSGELMVPPLKQDSRARRLAFSPDGTRLVAATKSGSIIVWNIAAAQPTLPSFVSPDHEQITSVRFSPDGEQVVTTEAAGQLQVWHTAAGERAGPRMIPQWETKVPRGFSFNRASRSADGRLLAAPSGDGTVRIWNALTGEPQPVILRPGAFVIWAEFSPLTDHLVTACDNGNVRVWDASTGKPVTSEMRHADFVCSARYSPDGRKLATVSQDGTARIWDAVTGEPVTPPLEHSGPVFALAFHPGGKKVATGGRFETVHIWDLSTGQTASVSPRHLGSVVDVCFSHNGKYLLTASLDQTARVWDIQTGEPVTPPMTHGDFVTAGNFSPDDRKVITCGHDGTARVWDAVTGEPLCMPFRHRKPVLDASFSPNGKWVVTASRDGTAQLWDVPTLELPAAEIAARAQLYAGVKLGPAGNLEPLLPRERAELLERVSRPSRHHSETSSNPNVR